MPCYTLSNASIKLKAENFSLLVEALEADSVEGLSLRSKTSNNLIGRYKDYSFTINSAGEIEIAEAVATAAANAVNRAYSRQVVKKTCKKFGWALKSENSSNNFVANKRGL